ncbi:hypothetical protein DNTS_020543, partial [Danionella cerebrum]
RSGFLHRSPLLNPPRSLTVLSTRGLLESDYRRPGAPIKDLWPWQMFKFDRKKGVEELKKNLKYLKSWLFDRFIGPEGKPLEVHFLEQTDVAFEFRGEESLENWLVSSDKEIGGSSEVYMKLGRNNTTCLLYGNLCSTPPNDGVTRYSGYCTMRSKQPTSFFNRKRQYDWSSFNTLHLRVRGDGRPWMVIIGVEAYYSHTKDDLYSYFLYTRGGPYWEDVNYIGFTLGDGADGPFELEIDYIGLCKDCTHTEECVY